MCDCLYLLAAEFDEIFFLRCKFLLAWLISSTANDNCFSAKDLKMGCDMNLKAFRGCDINLKAFRCNERFKFRFLSNRFYQGRFVDTSAFKSQNRKLLSEYVQTKRFFVISIVVLFVSPFCYTGTFCTAAGIFLR